MITLQAIADTCGKGYEIERLGGNVYGVTNFLYMITIDGGAESVESAADLLITDSYHGGLLFDGEIASAAEVPAILATL